jgi:hypothetical protein
MNSLIFPCQTFHFPDQDSFISHHPDPPPPPSIPSFIYIIPPPPHLLHFPLLTSCIDSKKEGSQYDDECQTKVKVLMPSTA